MMAERVGFVPDNFAPINDLGVIGTARTRQINSPLTHQTEAAFEPMARRTPDSPAAR
jgi:hypothetical protein